MNAMDAILSRRSIRRYTSQPISDEVVQELLAAAMAAPSAGNEQPWHFVVIKERQILNEIPTIHPYSQMLKEAPVAILVCGDECLEKHQGYWVWSSRQGCESYVVKVHCRQLPVRTVSISGTQEGNNLWCARK
jgi:nitroreductase